VLEMQDVVFSYPGHEAAVNHVSFTMEPGEFVGLAGRNGSGKTTLTRLLAGLSKPLLGKVMADGKTTKELNPAQMARILGYVFQNPDRQIFRDTVAEEVAFGPEQLEFSPEEKAAAVKEALEQTGLTELAREYPRTLPRSVRQKVAIASALSLRPRCMILDEPTSGQDAVERETLMQLLTELNQKGIGILLVTHDMDLLLRYTKRTVVLHQGEKVFDGPTEELFSQKILELADWGLRAPTAVAVAGELPLELPPLRTVEGLAKEIKKHLRGEKHEVTGSTL